MLSFNQLNSMRRMAVILAVCSAAFVPIYLLWQILNGSHMQFGDYFDMLGSLFSPDGVFTPAGLLQHANEHLILIPKLLYMLNAKIFDGSNISLGVIVWLISLATAFLLAWQLKRFFQTSSVNRIVLTWLFAVFLFPIAAAHNYLHAMSGAAWILANFFVVCALILASNNRLVSAGFLGSLATFSYGTGLAVWPALMLVVFLHRKITWRTGIMVFIGFVSVAIERLTSVSVLDHPQIETNPFALMRFTQIASGSIFSNSPEIALLLGAILLTFIGFFFLCILGTKSINTSEKVSSGIVGYGLTVLILFALSRGGFGDEVFLSSRYMGVVGLFTLGAILLSAFFFSHKIVWHLMASLLIMLNLSASVPVLTDTQARVLSQQELGAIAARLDISHEMIFGYRTQTGSVLRSLNHYPFNAKGDEIFCGLQGKTVESPLPGHEHEIHGWFDSAEALSASGALQTNGWVHSESEIECILMVDNDNVVVGAAVHGWDRDDARKAIHAPRKDIGWRGFALGDTVADLRAVVRLKNHTFLYELNKSNSVQVAK